jgi:hypothetical protein
MRLRIVHYDHVRHRLWILGQRCHHGATGALVTSLGLSRRSVLLAAAGSALMAHDWDDRSAWFTPGGQDQP